MLSFFFFFFHVEISGEKIKYNKEVYIYSKKILIF